MTSQWSLQCVDQSVAVLVSAKTLVSVSPCCPRLPFVSVSCFPAPPHAASSSALSPAGKEGGIFPVCSSSLLHAVSLSLSLSVPSKPVHVVVAVFQRVNSRVLPTPFFSDRRLFSPVCCFRLSADRLMRWLVVPAPWCQSYFLHQQLAWGGHVLVVVWNSEVVC